MENLFNRLMDTVKRTPRADDKIQILQKAALLSEKKGDFIESYQARHYLSQTASLCGRIEVLLESFFWCLEMKDQYPEYFSSEPLLYLYKSVASSMDKIPGISKEKIDFVFKDMKERFLASHFSLRPYYECCYGLAKRKGDALGMERAFHDWKNETTFDFTSCKMCELDFEMGFYIDKEDYESAKAVFRDIVTTPPCTEVPHRSYARWLLPHVHRSQMSDMLLLEEKGYFFIKGNPTFLTEISEHLLALSLVSSKKAMSVYERHIRFADETYDSYAKFCFYLASWVLFTKRKETHLAYTYYDLILQLALEFDTRNENNTFHMRITKMSECI